MSGSRLDVSASTTGGVAAEADRDEIAIPLAEEEARISKRRVITGRVRVSTVVDVSEEVVRGELSTADVAVTRVPIDRYVDTAPAIRTEGDITIVPVLEEVLVVETRLLLKEEIHISRTTSKEVVEQVVTLRKQRAVVEQLEGERPPAQD